MNIYIILGVNWDCVNTQKPCKHTHTVLMLCWLVCCAAFWQLAFAGVAVKIKHTHRQHIVCTHTPLFGWMEAEKYTVENLKFPHWTVIVSNAECSVCLHRTVFRFIGRMSWPEENAPECFNFSSTKYKFSNNTNVIQTLSRTSLDIASVQENANVNS